MINCDWVPYKDVYKCKKCGFVVKDPSIKKNCIKTKNRKNNSSIINNKNGVEYQQENIPPFSTRVFNFAKAAIKHAVNGSPQCTEEEIQERLKICKNCELFKPRGDGGVCSHENCGCNLKSQQIYLNKLAWADQECPLKKWGKIKKNPENGV